MNNDLFTLVTSGDIQKSIMIISRSLILKQNVEELDYIYIELCSYIGSFISLYDVSKYIDILSLCKKIIENDQIIIKDVYLLITKMCMLCEIYNRHPTTKCGTMCIKTLKQKISNELENIDMKLSANGIIRFDGVLPPPDNENYNVALSIIAIIIRVIKSTDDISLEYSTFLNDIGIKLKNILDYILRSKYKFETKFYSNDNDNTWFLWGIFSILYNEQFLSDAYWLYNYNFKKKYRSKRLGLIWALGVCSIYVHKKNISTGWSDNENTIIEKMNDISLKLYNEILIQLKKENPDSFETREKKKINEGIDFIESYIPVVNTYNGNKNIIKNEDNTHQKIKSIIY